MGERDEMIFKPVSATMQQSDCGQYQISRSPLSGGKFTYRAWFRPDNKILTTVEACDESGDRAAAVAECQVRCDEHLLLVEKN